MRSITRTIASVALLGICTAVHAIGQTVDTSLNLVPWPEKVEVNQGFMSVNGNTRIVATHATLVPLAKILSEEIATVTGRTLNATADKPKAGDIVLQLDSSLKGEAHTVSIVKNGAIVKGGNYQAVALGTVSVLQALKQSGDALGLPIVTITDAPKADYRGLMLDVARKPHSIQNIKHIVNLCRLYKTRYLQLHLTDDQLWMFPSKAYPLMGTKNDGGVKPYTEAELKDLVAYADARGVTIIPEFDVPGHCHSFIKTMPEVFSIADTKPYVHHASINFAKPEVMKAVETIVGEMCEIFKSTPYFHIGGDEADLAHAGQNIHFQEAMKKLDLPNVHEFYRHFLVQMNDIVKKQNKQMIVWEGFHPGGKVKIPKDIIVMAYEIAFYQPNKLIEDGYTVINASWTPLYVVKKKVRPASEIYAWKMEQFKPHGAAPEASGVIVPKSKLLIGAQLCAWEQPEEMEIPSLRGRVPAVMERIWNPDAGKEFSDFEKRFTETDKIFEKLIQ
jgi:hexosaminidase